MFLHQSFQLFSCQFNAAALSLLMLVPKRA
jgi:hypothetical protein